MLSHIFLNFISNGSDQSALKSVISLNQNDGPKPIQKLTTPVTLGKLVDNLSDSNLGKKSIFDITREDMTVSFIFKLNEFQL